MGDRFTDPVRLSSTQSINRSTDHHTVLPPGLRLARPSLSSRSATVPQSTSTVSAPSYRSVHLPPTDPLVSRFSSLPPSTPPPVEALRQLTHAAYDFILSRLNELAPEGNSKDTVAERSIIAPAVSDDVVVEMPSKEQKTSVERSTDSARREYPVIVDGGKGEAYLRNEDRIVTEAERARAAAVDAFFRSLPVEPLRGFIPV